MERFLLFIGDSYYADGGWYDFKGDYNSLGEALRAVEAKILKDDTWWHIVDVNEKRISVKKDGCYCGTQGEDDA